MVSLQLKKNKTDWDYLLALGGCGVRLYELTNLYSAFANSGVYQKLKFIETDSLSNDTVRIVSPGAAYLTTEILSRLRAPTCLIIMQTYFVFLTLHGKTGTSYGRRDAWSIGYNKRFTVGVWLGNYNGNGVAEL